jgi:hypothetical protein
VHVAPRANGHAAPSVWSPDGQVLRNWPVSTTQGSVIVGAEIVSAGPVIVNATGMTPSITPTMLPGCQQHHLHVRVATSSIPAPIAAQISHHMGPPASSIPIAVLVLHIHSEPSRKPSRNPSHSASPYGDIPHFPPWDLIDPQAPSHARICLLPAACQLPTTCHCYGSSPPASSFCVHSRSPVAIIDALARRWPSGPLGPWAVGPVDFLHQIVPALTCDCRCC